MLLRAIARRSYRLARRWTVNILVKHQWGVLGESELSIVAKCNEHLCIWPRGDRAVQGDGTPYGECLAPLVTVPVTSVTVPIWVHDGAVNSCWIAAPPEAPSTVTRPDWPPGMVTGWVKLPFASVMAEPTKV